jgi:DNA polymerase III subunit delta'
MKSLFDEILGNDLIIKSLQSSIKLDKVSHAYIFSGPTGIGKKLIARTFAKTLQCEEKSTNPCNKCTSCIAFESNNHPDVFYITLNKTKSIGVEQVQNEINSKIFIKAYKYEYKIFIIDKANTLTTASQNTLLKTIEEPNLKCVFMFLTENHSSMLTTILSRCVLYKIHPLPLDLVERYVSENYDIDDNKKNLISSYACGNIGKVKMLTSDEEFIDIRNYFIGIGISLANSDTVKLFLLAKEIISYKDRIQEALDILYIWYRDILIFKVTNCTNNIISQDILNEIIEKAKNIEIKGIFNSLDSILEAKLNLQSNSNLQLTIEVLLIKLRASVTS